MKYATHRGDTGRWCQRYDITLWLHTMRKSLDESSLCAVRKRQGERNLFICYLADPGPKKYYGSDRRHLRRG